jgi:hypothetical protein
MDRRHTPTSSSSDSHAENDAPTRRPGQHHRRRPRYNIEAFLLLCDQLFTCRYQSYTLINLLRIFAQGAASVLLHTIPALQNSQVPWPLFRNEFLRWYLRTGVETTYASIRPKRREQAREYLVRFYYALTDERLRRQALRLPSISDRQAGRHYLRSLPRRLRQQINIPGPGSDSLQDIIMASVLLTAPKPISSFT